MTRRRRALVLLSVALVALATLVSIVAAGIGMAIGQVLSQFFGWRLIVLGEVQLIPVLIGGLLALVLINRPD